jgi:hypothetical protein
MTEEAMQRFGKLVREAGETISARLGTPPGAREPAAAAGD